MEAVGGVAAIYQLAEGVIKLCRVLKRSLGAKAELVRAIEELDSLGQILERLSRIDAAKTKVSEFAFSAQLVRCHDELESLKVFLKGFRESRTRSLKIQWILKEKELIRRFERLSAVKQDLSFSMGVDQTELLVLSREEGFSLPTSSADDGNRSQRHEIIKWLDSATSSSSVCDDAQKARSADTCTWLLNDSSIVDWRASPHSRIWLHGIPGCGKTVFTSAVVEVLKEHCLENKDQLLAYHFFEFASRDKDAVNSFLRSLMSQIVAQRKVVSSALQKLYNDNHEGVQRPSNKALLETLRTVLKECQDVYVVIDAVDECDNRIDLLETLQQMVAWKISGLHLLVSSQENGQIEEFFRGFPQICLQGQEHKQDIRKYVEQRLLKEHEWKKWPVENQKEIAAAVVEKAENMFRLAKLHLDALQKCRTPKALRYTMSVLPTTLDETYTRILNNIAREHVPDAWRILTWLCFALRPPTISELAAAIAVDTKTLEYDKMQEYQDPEDVFSVCGSLLTRSLENGRNVVKLSHASVRDYLTSNRFVGGTLPKLSSEPGRGDEQICTVCLVYLKSHNYEGREQARTQYRKDCLIEYATSFWPEHFRHARDNPVLLELAQGLLLGQSMRFIRWAWIGTFLPTGFHVENLTENSEDLQARLDTVLYYAAFLGNIALIEAILSAGAKVNGRGGIFGTSLAAATIKGDIETAEYLLKAGSDVNARTGDYGRALHIASYYSHLELIELLIAHGADVQAYGGVHYTVLHAAIEGDHRPEETVKLLIEAGADVLSANTYEETPLIVAADLGQDAIARFLISANANVNDGSLHVALRKGSFSIASMLIRAGAGVTTVNPKWGTLVGSAAVYGVPALHTIVQHHDIDIYAVDREGRSALHVAAFTGDALTVRYLLRLGLQADSKDNKGWSAVHYAALVDTTSCLEFLLPLWTVDHSGWTPLHLACRRNTPKAIELLVEAGLEARPITTKDPPRNWSLRDITFWEDNWKLRWFIPDVQLQDLLQMEPPFDEARSEQSSEPETPTKSTWRCCDGCQPTLEPIPTSVPTYHCKECPDFDYCVICMSTAAKTHSHLSWEPFGDIQSKETQIMVDFRKHSQSVPLHFDPLEDD